MPTLNSVTKTARIVEEDREVIEQYMKDKGVTFSGFVKDMAELVSNPTSNNIPSDIIADFEVILNLYDTDFESFFKALYKKVESMEIDVDEVMK